MRRIDFNDLPRATRERFVRSLVSDSPAARPICKRVSRLRSPLLWYVLLVASVAGLVALTSVAFGAVAAPVQDRRFLAAYVGLWALLGLSVAMLARRTAVRGSLPFAPGVYVFPIDLVDARTRELELYPLSELQSLDPVHHTKSGKYTHTALWFIFPTNSFVFVIRGREQADAQVAAVQRARENVALALQRGGLDELAAFDPFADARARNFEPAHDHGLLARGRPLWTRFVWAITIIVGLSGGVGWWRLRNWQSDRRALARVTAAPDVAFAEAYAQGGGLHAAEVRDHVLPRARLAVATSEPDVSRRAEAIERFLLAYPGSSAEADARAALAAALHDHVMAQRTVSGLRAFVARWPQSKEVPAAEAKIRELVVQARADLDEHANPAEKSVVPVVRAMLAHAETAAPIEVRVRRRKAGSLAAADRLLAKGLLDDGGPVRGGNAAIAPLFGGDDPSRLDGVLVAGLRHALRVVFPADLFTLTLGAPAADATPQGTARPLADVTAPTLVVDYEIGWAGTTYVARASQRRYLGLSVELAAVVQVPGEPRGLEVSAKVQAPERVALEQTAEEPVVQALAALPPSAGAEADARVYGLMLARAFDQVAARMLAVVFEPHTAAARAPREEAAIVAAD